MAKSKSPLDERRRRAVAEILEHAGQYVARNESREPIAYAATEEELEAELCQQGIPLQAVIVGRVPLLVDSYVF